MKSMRLLSLLLLAIALDSALASSGPNKPGDGDFQHAGKPQDKLEKAAFKQQLKDQRSDCRHHPKTVACNDLKERQKMEKRQFKEEEKAEKSKRH